MVVALPVAASVVEVAAVVVDLTIESPTMVEVALFARMPPERVARPVALKVVALTPAKVEAPLTFKAPPMEASLVTVSPLPAPWRRVGPVETTSP